MDLYAYGQIDDLKKYLEENNIDIPRLRGLRLMKDETPIGEEKIKEDAEKTFLYWFCQCRKKKIEDVHGKARKKYKLYLKQFKKQYDMFNKYVGKNVLYVHARVGGANWDFFGMDKITKHPLYLERVDDYLDSTYCDIYFKLKEN
jgi:hypothetical protein